MKDHTDALSDGPLLILLAALLLLILVSCSGCQVAPMTDLNGQPTGDYVIGISAGASRNLAQGAGDLLSLMGVPFGKPLAAVLSLLLTGGGVHGVYRLGKDHGWDESDQYHAPAGQQRAISQGAPASAVARTVA